MTAKDITLDYIRTYCAANAEAKAWHNAIITTTIKCEVYPRKKNESGKTVADKSQPPVIQERPIPFVNLRAAFIAKYMPELAPKEKPAKSKMYQPL